jgi:RNA polymerase sigma-70 factor (sigma-E family)
VSSTPAPDFAQFYAASWPRLLRTTYAVAGDRQRAEDALQTAFAQAYARWARVSRAQDPLAYVRKMAVNAALAQHRRAFARRESGGEPPELPVEGGEDAALARDEVWTAVRRLPPRQRAVVVLRYYEDLSERQIADVLRCRPGTVKSQAAAALATLRARLGEAAPASEEERA